MRRKLVFTAFNRPWYLEESIATWNDARGILNWNVEFFIEPSASQDGMRDAAFKLNANCVIVGINRTQQGVLVNPWQALNSAFNEGAEFVVLAEDDVAVSQDVLEYFEWASEAYLEAPEVLCINAFSARGTGTEEQIIRDQQFSPLIWGIWRDRWVKLIRNTWDKNYSSGNTDGSEAGWDWNINRILKREQMYVIKPAHSRSDHLGKYAGTHMTPDLYDSSRGARFTQIRGQQRYIEL